jgi:hypothetical protein
VVNGESSDALTARTRYVIQPGSGSSSNLVVFVGSDASTSNPARASEVRSMTMPLWPVERFCQPTWTRDYGRISSAEVAGSGIFVTIMIFPCLVRLRIEQRVRSGRAGQPSR